MTNKEVYEIVAANKKALDDFILEQRKINELVVRHDEKIIDHSSEIKKHDGKFKLVFTSIFGSGGFLVVSLGILKFLKII